VHALDRLATVTGETWDTDSIFTQLVSRKDFITYSRRKSFNLYMDFLGLCLVCDLVPNQSGNLVIDARIILKWTSRNRVGERELDTSSGELL
jgi:hypothetical protein